MTLDMLAVQMLKVVPLCLLLVCGTPSVLAFEGGSPNYLPGFYGDFSMAIIPEKGTFLNNFFAAYQDAGGDYKNLIELPGIIHATGYKLFGGNYSFGIYPGILASKYHTNDVNLGRVGLTDVYLLPAALGWSWENCSVLAYEGILAPTGHYQTDALNTGLNIWTFDHNLSLSVQLPGDNELSTNVGYMNNLKNPTTDYHSGDLMHLDYMLGQYFTPFLGIGLVGSYYYQTTSDHAPASLLIPERSEGATIGPVITYTPEILAREFIFTLKWLHEFDVNGRPKLDYMIFRVWKEF